MKASLETVCKFALFSQSSDMSLISMSFIRVVNLTDSVFLVHHTPTLRRNFVPRKRGHMPNLMRSHRERTTPLSTNEAKTYPTTSKSPNGNWAAEGVH
jgi:hypothetical protein